MRIGGLLPKAVLAACVLIAAPTLLLLALGEGHSTPADRFGLTGAGGLSFLVAAIAFAVVGARAHGTEPK